MATSATCTHETETFYDPHEKTHFLIALIDDPYLVLHTEECVEGVLDAEQ